MTDERAHLTARVAELRAQGKCRTCHDIETGEPYGRGDRLICEDERFLVLLARFPRMRGHMIVVYKPHREDVSALSEVEGAEVMAMCLRVIRAIKASLGAEKVYLNTMCDGPQNHLHLQLFPRYTSEQIGSRRFVLPRMEIEDAAGTAVCVRAALT